MTTSVAITTAETLVNSFNKNRGVQATDLYAFILKSVTSYVIVTGNMNSHGVLGHADVSEDAASYIICFPVPETSPLSTKLQT